MYFHRRMVWVVCVLFSLGLLSNCDMLFFGTEYAPRSIAVSVDDNIKASPNMKMKMKMKSSVGLYSDSAVWFVVAVTPKGEKTMATTTDQLNYVLTLYTDLRYALYFGYILGNETNIQPMRFFDGQSSFKMSKGLNKDASQINLGKLTVSSNGTLTLDKTPEAFIDSDKDGIIDSDDPDDDNDGISDVMDLDSDNDGVSDFFALVDRDMNGYPDILEKTATDTDNNGIPDIVEKKSFATATNTKNSDYYYLTSLITADDNISFYRSGSLWSNSAIAFVLDTNFNLYHTNAFATVYTSLAAVVTNKSSVWATAVSNYNVAIGNSDTTVPVIAINNLPIQTNNGNLIIKGSASDNSQIAEVWLSVSMSTNAFQKISAATNWVKSFNMLPRGVYTIQAYAKDAAGNVSAIVQKTIKLTWWSYIGSPNLTGGEVGELSLFETNGGVYLATADSVNHYGTIRKYNGSSWSVIGGGILTNFRVDYLSVGIYSNSIPVVAFSDSSLTNKASVMYFNGTNWKYLGLPGFSSGAAYSVKMKIIQDIIFVAYIDAAKWKSGYSDEVFIRKLDTRTHCRTRYCISKPIDCIRIRRIYCVSGLCELCEWK